MMQEMPRRPARFSRLILLGLVVLLPACARKRRPAVYPTPPPGYAAQPGAQPGVYPQQPGVYPQPGTYTPGAAPVATTPPAPGAPVAPAIPAQPALPPVLIDPINQVDIGFLRGRAQTVMAELVQNLPAAQRARVQNIPLIVDDEVGEVNAFAACTREGKSAMAISDGLLDIQAHLSQAQATDELFGSRKVDEYVRLIAQNQRPKTPIVRPAPGFFNPGQSVDGRKVQRQHQVLDEQLAFVLGHELAHHYLGHLPCTAGAGLSAAEVGRILSDAVPLFNQPNELAADMAGVNNVLTTGSRRATYRLTEGGALLTMRFFAGVDQFSPADILFGFERTHPPPAVRSPVIQQTASAWRATGGQGLPIISF
jgi:hypothetical protein